MTSDDPKAGLPREAALWRAARAAQATAAPAREAADPLLLAAYLDGSLSEAERALLEADLLEDDDDLELLLASHAARGARTAVVPPALVARAAAIVGAARRKERALARLAVFWRGFRAHPGRPALAAAAMALYLLVFFGAFELGRLQGFGDIRAQAESGENLFDVLDGTL